MQSPRRWRALRAEMEAGWGGIDWQAVWLTIELATVTTVILLLIGTPLAW